jgi:N-acetylglutamate synthase-like GNAT family acetyltransferase
MFINFTMNTFINKNMYIGKRRFSMEIRYTTKLTEEEDIYSLYDGLRWNDFLKLNRDQLVKAMEQSYYVIYAYIGEKLIGTGRVISDGVTNAYLCGLGVAEEHRSKGIGTEISKRLVEHCKRNNLHIQFFCEEKLVSYYKKMGFEVFAVGMKVKK